MPASSLASYRRSIRCARLFVVFEFVHARGLSFKSSIRRELSTVVCLPNVMSTWTVTLHCSRRVTHTTSLALLSRKRSTHDTSQGLLNPCTESHGPLLPCSFHPRGCLRHKHLATEACYVRYTPISGTTPFVRSRGNH